MEDSKKLKRKLRVAIISVIIALLAVSAATFAWYMYNTSSHTTNVHMAAGAGASLVISNQYDGPYGSAAVLDEFVGELVPVSTDKIANGFQHAEEFAHGSGDQPPVIAVLFGAAEKTDYYKTSLYLKTSAENSKIYISDIGFEDSDKENPISSAIRVGVVAHKPGADAPVAAEYIFEITDAKNPKRVYNTDKGHEGQVLDSTKKDGSTVDFKPYNSSNYCIYDKNTGVVTLKDSSIAVCELNGNNGDFGDAVQVDLYIWLEGCDSDCYNNICSETLKSLAVSFAAK